MNQEKVFDTIINYDISGSGQTLLFIHGAYLSKDEWVYQQDFFSKYFQVVCVDLPGHGGSGKLPFYSIEVMADYIAGLLENLGLSPCFVCGHSLGGMVAQALTLQHPELIRRLVLAETSYGVKSNPVEAFLTALTMPILKRVSIENQTEMFANQMGRQSVETKAYVARDIIKHAADHDNYNRIWDATVNFAGKDKLKTIACPTLIIVGEKNKQTHQQAKVMKSLIPNAELVYIESAGHMVNMDNPEAFNNAALRFLQSKVQ